MRFVNLTYPSPGEVTSTKIKDIYNENNENDICFTML